GATEDCARKLKAIADRATRESISNEEAAKRTLAAMRETGERMSGFGHRVHTKDPRTARLFELARCADLWCARDGRIPTFVRRFRALLRACVSPLLRLRSILVSRGRRLL